MYMVIDMFYDDAVFFGREEDCKKRAQSMNNHVKTERYTYTRDNDYAIAL